MISPHKMPQTVFTRALRRKLRGLRLEAGMTLKEPAEYISVSNSTLQRMEVGEGPIRPIQARALCELYNASERDTELVLSLVQKGRQNPWYTTYEDVTDDRITMYLDLESSASDLRWYESNIIPGLLQSPDYCRALYRSSRPDAEDDEVERLVGLRMDRAKLITRKRSPTTLRAVVGESALRRRVGGSEAMASQMAHLERMMELPHVEVRALDFNAGAHRAMSQGNLVIMDFDDHGPIPAEPTTAYIGIVHAAVYVDGDRARPYEDVFASMWDQALPKNETASLIREVAKEMTA